MQWNLENVNESGSKPWSINKSGPHTVYTILNDPMSPWVNTFGNPKNAWVKALDFAIESAGCAGVVVASNALRHITHDLHSGHGLTYDTTNGASAYTSLNRGWNGSTYFLYVDMELSNYIEKNDTHIINCTSVP